jgi:hypothetical protein
VRAATFERLAEGVREVGSQNWVEEILCCFEASGTYILSELAASA